MLISFAEGNSVKPVFCFGAYFSYYFFNTVMPCFVGVGFLEVEKDVVGFFGGYM